MLSFETWAPGFSLCSCDPLQRGALVRAQVAAGAVNHYVRVRGTPLTDSIQLTCIGCKIDQDENNVAKGPRVPPRILGAEVHTLLKSWTGMP